MSTLKTFRCVSCQQRTNSSAQSLGPCSSCGGVMIEVNEGPANAQAAPVPEVVEVAPLDRTQLEHARNALVMCNLPERTDLIALVDAELVRGHADLASQVGRAMVDLWLAFGFINFGGKGDTIAALAARARAREATRVEMITKLDADLRTQRERASKLDAHATKLVERREQSDRERDAALKEAADARAARDQLFLELQALREATMLEPPDGDWGRLTADHVRQHVQDLADARDMARREADGARAELQRIAAKLAPALTGEFPVSATAEALAVFAAGRIDDQDSEIAEWRDAASHAAVGKIETPVELRERLQGHVDRYAELLQERDAARTEVQRGYAERSTELVEVREALDFAGAPSRDAAGNACSPRQRIALLAQERNEAVAWLCQVGHVLTARGFDGAALGETAGAVERALGASVAAVQSAHQLLDHYEVARTQPGDRDEDELSLNERITALADERYNARRELAEVTRERDELAEEMARGADPQAVAEAIDLAAAAAPAPPRPAPPRPRPAPPPRGYDPDELEDLSLADDFLADVAERVADRVAAALLGRGRS